MGGKVEEKLDTRTTVSGYYSREREPFLLNYGCALAASKRTIEFIAAPFLLTLCCLVPRPSAWSD